MGGYGSDEAETVGTNWNRLPGYLILLILGAVLGVAGAAMYYRMQPAPILISTPGPTPSPAATSTPGPIHVYVSGAVVAAAVYDLPPSSRVEQAIEAAGGFTAEANTAAVNLALPLSDGIQIYVPTVGESGNGPAWGVNQPAPVGETAPAGLKVNINTATLDQLDRLPGIGPSIAQNIVDYRDANGPFSAIEAIMDVSGIGEAKFDQMKDLIVVAGE